MCGDPIGWRLASRVMQNKGEFTEYTVREQRGRGGRAGRSKAGEGGGRRRGWERRGQEPGSGPASSGQGRGAAALSVDQPRQPRCSFGNSVTCYSSGRKRIQQLCTNRQVGPAPRVPAQWVWAGLVRRVVERRAGAGLRSGAVLRTLLPELVPVARPDARSAAPPRPLPRGVETKGAQRAELSQGGKGRSVWWSRALCSLGLFLCGGRGGEAGGDLEP